MASLLQIDVTLLDLTSATNRPQLGWMLEGAPRNAARHRMQDQLLLFTALQPGPAAPQRLYEALLTAAYDAYFRSTGTVTASARDAISAANQQLNIIPNAQGSQASIACAVVKENELYVVQAGASHCFALKSNAVEDFSLLPELTRPLVGSTAPDFHYSHCRLDGNEYLLIAPFMSHNITDSRVQRVSRGTPRVFMSMLLKEFGSNFRSLAAHITVEPPSQTMSHAASFAAERFGLRPQPVEPPPTANIQEAIAQIEEQSAAAVVAPDESLIDTDTKELILGQEPQFDSPEIYAEPIPEPDAGEIPESFTQEVQAAAAGWIDSTPEPAPQPARPKAAYVETEAFAAEIDEDDYDYEPREPLGDQISARLSGMSNGLRSWFVNLPLVGLRDGIENGVGGIFGSITGGSRNIAGRLTPREQDERPVSPQVLLSIAILIPLVIGMLAAIIVIRFGRAAQYDTHYALAIEQATVARTSADQVIARNTWYEVVRELNSAAVFQPNDPGITQLRREAETALDQIENVIRVRNPQVIDTSGLPRDTEFDHMAYVEGALYVADEDLATVYRFERSAEGNFYLLDDNFNCNGREGVLQLTSIIDIAPQFFPNESGKVGIVALSSDGVLAWCASGESMRSTQLESLASGWGRPVQIEVFANALYVLNPAFQAIWVYQPAGNLGGLNPQPFDYFGADKPDLSNVIDFTIGNGEVYLLTDTGETWRCSTGTAEAAPTCGLMVFQDSRPDFPSGERIMDIRQPFAIQYTAPPETSLYIVDNATFGFYRVSTDGVLQVQYKPPTQIEGRPSAFVAGNAKELFFASGTQLYAATRP